MAIFVVVYVIFLDNAGDGAGHGAYKQACWGKNDGLQHPYKVGLMQTDRGSWLFSSVSLLASSASATGASHGNTLLQQECRRGRRLYIALHRRLQWICRALLQSDRL